MVLRSPWQGRGETRGNRGGRRQRGGGRGNEGEKRLASEPGSTARAGESSAGGAAWGPFPSSLKQEWPDFPAKLSAFLQRIFHLAHSHA